MDFDIDSWKPMLDEAGGAIYLVDIDAFQRNVQQFLNAFRAEYPNTNIGYSYKANYLAALCGEARRLGLYAEVVSGSEYEMARRHGVPHDHIIFNGPVKTEPELELALRRRATVNIDCFEEIEKVQRVCRRYPDESFRVGIRCSLPLENSPVSRFGFTPEDRQLHTAFQRLNGIPNCSVAGLHCHSSSDRTVKSVGDRTELMLDVADQLFRDTRPTYLDLGGGFCGAMPNSLGAQLSCAPSFHDYARCIARPMRDRYGMEGITRLLLEPGVGLLADTMQFACEVVAVKQQGSRNIAVTAGSVHNLGPLSGTVNLPIHHLPVSTVARIASDHIWDVAGYTCMEDDILYRGLPGPVSVFNNVGAYSLVFKPPFIRGTPPVLSWDAQERTWQRLQEQQPLTKNV